ncbi:hypothetical protein FNJ84_17770 [Paracoccus sp. M683]|uniref:glycoside hydrolase family 108 protein n=1 Tax=Paracoccus sp. M683 TaxID=2594268 RepID=UPI00117F0B89|nr:glycosyl hydrolase 108 family protein [Paracoccus sp. M683]TRW94941.1 hypothetical protein FNJ84_17770 [Paracoccus sp. M683]
MRDNFDRCLRAVLAHESGWADHPSDPGGATMKGITIGTYRAWKGRTVSKTELRNISDAEVSEIYRKNYWDNVRGDDLPSGLDLVAFDAAVNSGVSRGAKWLQGAVGAAADGAVGPNTVSAARAADPFRAVNAACDARLQFLHRLKTWPTFGKGWSRRVAEVREMALSMAFQANVIPPAGPNTPIGEPFAVTNPLATFFAALARILGNIFGGK